VNGSGRRRARARWAGPGLPRARHAPGLPEGRPAPGELANGATLHRPDAQAEARPVRSRIGSD